MYDVDINLIRNLYPHELALLTKLLAVVNINSKYEIPDKVYTMNDGGMGSIHFVTKEQRYKDDLVIATYTDADNVPVFISLTIGTENLLFELDIWKANFSKLLMYPSPHQIIIDSIK